MYKIIPNLQNEFNCDTDILTCCENFIIRYDSKEDKKEAIDKIFSSIVTFSHHVVDKIHTTYIGTNIFKEIINFLNKNNEIKEIIYSDFVSNYYKFFSRKDFVTNIKENLNKEFKISLEQIEDILKKSLSLKVLSPSITQIPIYNFYKKINNFDFVSRFMLNDIELYYRNKEPQFKIKENHYVLTSNKCISSSLYTEINIDICRIAAFSDSIIDFSFFINLNEYFTDEQIKFVKLFNNFMESYFSVSMLSKISDPMYLSSNIEDINKLLDEKMKIIKRL